MFAGAQRKIAFTVAVAASVCAAAGTASAGVPTLAILIQHAVFARSSLKSPKLHASSLSLTLPDDIAREVSQKTNARLLPTETEAEPDETGMFFGPQFIDPSHAGKIRGMVKTMPEPAKKILTAPVGPWAMSAQPIGNSWSAGPSMYARF
jgi:hypothetical protein